LYGGADYCTKGLETTFHPFPMGIDHPLETALLIARQAFPDWAAYQNKF